MARSVLMAIEKPVAPRPTLRQMARDLGPQEIGNAFVALIFSASGPLAVILAAAAAGNLTPEQTSSWIFGAFLGNGLLTLFLTYWYRSPQAYFWTIPGTVIVGDAMSHLSFGEVIGAYLATGVLVFLLGWTGLIGRIMEVIPHTIVMAMVAGVFLRFGLELVTSAVDAPLIAIPMIVLFVVVSMIPKLAKVAPPVAVAAVVGTLVAIADGQLADDIFADGIFASPVITMPEFSLAAMAELVVPLAITVVIVQNSQGLAVLRAAGHQQGVNLSAAASGLWSLPVAFFGTTSTCLTGPTNALLVSGGNKDRHYVAALTMGVLAIIVGLFAPAATGFMLGMPAAFIAALAGIAMLAPLKNAFLAGFSGPFSTGALVCFLITASNISILNISAPFWGIVFGGLIAWCLDRERPAKPKKSEQAEKSGNSETSGASGAQSAPAAPAPTQEAAAAESEAHENTGQDTGQGTTGPDAREDARMDERDRARQEEPSKARENVRRPR